MDKSLEKEHEMGYGDQIQAILVTGGELGKSKLSRQDPIKAQADEDIYNAMFGEVTEEEEKAADVADLDRMKTLLLTVTVVAIVVGCLVSQIWRWWKGSNTNTNETTYSQLDTSSAYGDSNQLELGTMSSTDGSVNDDDDGTYNPLSSPSRISMNLEEDDDNEVGDFKFEDYEHYLDEPTDDSISGFAEDGINEIRFSGNVEDAVSPSPIASNNNNNDHEAYSPVHQLQSNTETPHR